MEPLAARVAAGQMVSLVLRLGDSQSQALQCQAPRMGPLVGDLGLGLAPRRLAGSIRPCAVMEVWAEVRYLASRSVGQSILALIWGAFEGHRWLGGYCPFCHPEGLATPLEPILAVGLQGASGAGTWGSPIHGMRCQATWEGPHGGDLGIGLGPGSQQARSASSAESRGVGLGEGAGERSEGHSVLTQGAFQSCCGSEGPDSE